jgi:hypothetical protein
MIELKELQKLTVKAEERKAMAQFAKQLGQIKRLEELYKHFKSRAKKSKKMEAKMLWLEKYLEYELWQLFYVMPSTIKSHVDNAVSKSNVDVVSE